MTQLFGLQQAVSKPDRFRGKLLPATDSRLLATSYTHRLKSLWGRATAGFGIFAPRESPRTAEPSVK